ncbi:MAG: type III-B CRISPR module-associated protein Cmr5 [Thermoflexales bacterium]|nr:type III-B CRISPR module-associated protein Cmr5 [Thermoflexales bacterium]MCX7939735.1 type III-B CRISPR module-associated protein Cmr5 [Thermoflexales bacterium]MDW8054375.1 type III-B CRISPR module-associated protein Cmr5 [Anaerolineae bacterium]MDW8292824.1 type III-B CRISPR module-associated protein Cmr5 [Anaerolineae bacterium]
MSAQRTLEQERAKHAWSHVRGVPTSLQKEFKSITNSLPADIQANGLGQTLAFLKAKSKGEKGEAHKRVLEAVNDWARQRLRFDHSQDLLTWITQTANSEDYRHATAEVIAYAIWLKRFAEAELADTGAKSDDQSNPKAK